jgi:plasmid stabilization system protein ParE
MIFRFHPLAFSELEESVKYYSDIREDLGIDFIDEIDLTIERIIQFPLAWSQHTKFCRRCLTHRFPYAVIYQIKEDNIIIIAVMPLNRKPDYWKVRVSST